MKYLVDTNVLVRLANHADSHYPIALNAVIVLHRQNVDLYITPQNLIEFRNVATRPVSANGLGLTAIAAAAKAADFEIEFPLLEETNGIYSVWKAIVDALGIIGKRVHDARLAAVCHIDKIDGILTFNGGDFQQISTLAPTLAIVDPATV